MFYIPLFWDTLNWTKLLKKYLQYHDIGTDLDKVISSTHFFSTPTPTAFLLEAAAPSNKLGSWLHNNKNRSSTCLWNFGDT